MSDGRDLWNIAVGYWTGIMGGSSLVESLGVEYGYKGGCSSEISGGNFEGAELGDSGSGVCYTVDMSGRNGYGKLEGYPNTNGDK